MKQKRPQYVDVEKRRRFERLRKVQDDFGRFFGGVVDFYWLFLALSIDLLKSFLFKTCWYKSLFGRNLVFLVWDT